MARKPKRGRYTPKKDRSVPTELPPIPSMKPTAIHLPAADDGSARMDAQQKFFEGATFPQALNILFPTAGPPGSTDRGLHTTLPPMLVALVNSEEIDPDLRRLFDARAAQVHPVAWAESIVGKVGWTTMASLSGDPVADAQASFAKLNFDLTGPMRYQASFLFHLGQTLDAVKAVVNGGLFAIGLPELVQQLAALSIADAMESLPFFTLPAAPQLASFLKRLEPPD